MAVEEAGRIQNRGSHRYRAKARLMGLAYMSVLYACFALLLVLQGDDGGPFQMVVVEAKRKYKKRQFREDKWERTLSTIGITYLCVFTPLLLAFAWSLYRDPATPGVMRALWKYLRKHWTAYLKRGSGTGTDEEEGSDSTRSASKKKLRKKKKQKKKADDDWEDGEVRRRRRGTTRGRSRRTTAATLLDPETETDEDIAGYGEHKGGSRSHRDRHGGMSMPSAPLMFDDGLDFVRSAGEEVGGASYELLAPMQR